MIRGLVISVEVINRLQGLLQVEEGIGIAVKKRHWHLG